MTSESQTHKEASTSSAKGRKPKMFAIFPMWLTAECKTNIFSGDVLKRVYLMAALIYGWRALVDKVSVHSLLRGYQ